MNRISISKKLIDGEYYKYDENKGFKLLDPKDIVYKSHTVKSLDNYYKSYLDKKNDEEKINLLLRKVLFDYNIELENQDYKYTIQKCVQILKNLNIEVKHVNTFKLNENGFVERFDKGRYILSKNVKNVPTDLNSGCYKLIVNTQGELIFKLDEEKYESEMM